MSVKLEFLGENPVISIDKTNFTTGNFVTVKIGEVEINLDLSDAKYLADELDAASNDYEDSKDGLKEKITELEVKLEDLEEELEEVAASEDRPSYYGFM